MATKRKITKKNNMATKNYWRIFNKIIWPPKIIGEYLTIVLVFSYLYLLAGNE